MIISKGIQETKEILRKVKKQGLTIGFVPTMGYLHEGHLSLIRRAKEENDYVVVSIFVNPLQFAANEDFDQYPQDFERDSKLSEEAGADFIFAPTAEEMYPKDYKTYVDVVDLTEGLCGGDREGHFKGVTTVVTRLLNIVHPDYAYFGQKDAQQATVVRKMTQDLNMDTEIIVCDIVREEDGLAMSSRNVYLSQKEREESRMIYKSLKLAEEKIACGERCPKKIKKEIKRVLEDNTDSKIEYISLVDVQNLKEVDKINDDVLIALAAKFGQTRLIDNIKIEIR